MIFLCKWVPAVNFPFFFLGGWDERKQGGVQVQKLQIVVQLEPRKSFRRPNGLPLGRIGESLLPMDQPKDQPLCLVNWTPREKL